MENELIFVFTFVIGVGSKVHIEMDSGNIKFKVQL